MWNAFRNKVGDRANVTATDRRQAAHTGMERTNWAGLTMSVHRSRPEVADPRVGLMLTYIKDSLARHINQQNGACEEISKWLRKAIPTSL